ncbi:MAG: helix-turn-helix transcriptional regulator [Clostridia bacterium]|nr:helix-turn-helix transcriptional regulator [Clostridia bacterium]
MKLNEAVGKRILEFGKKRKITPNKLCTMSGVIQSTVNSIFSGRSKNPKLATIQYLCFGLGISFKDFFDSPLFDNLED